ncbi:COQ9-domain-containing protein [Phlyctochytrium arcticum]|nr:COQ9-domain-containing protein [Phlyctochytrium arcticum]
MNANMASTTVYRCCSRVLLQKTPTRIAPLCAASSLRTRSTCRTIASQASSPSPHPNDPTKGLAYDVNLMTPKGKEAPRASNSESQHSETAIRILDAALLQVPKLGWTVEALGAGATELGYPSVLHGLFPRGSVDLIDYFLKKSLREMREEMEKLDLPNMKVTAKIRTACLIRLKLTQPYISRWPEALAIMAQPQNLSMSLGNLESLVDEMWYLAGDRSVDMNWYSKRTLLAGVFTSTELYMTQDRSINFEETSKFLDRRLQDVAFVGKSFSQVSNYVAFGVRSAFGILSSYGHKTPYNR